MPRLGAREKEAREQAARITRATRAERAAALSVEGRSHAEIARELKISETTVRRLLGASLAKVAAMDEAELAEVSDRLPPKPVEAPQQRALQLRQQGLSFARIARELEIDDETARRWVYQELERLEGAEVRSIDLARRLELERLDALQTGFWVRALKGEAEAAGMVLKISERRSKLLGLDAPIKVDVEAEVRELAIQIGVDPDDLVEEARALVQQVSRKALKG